MWLNMQMCEDVIIIVNQKKKDIPSWSQSKIVIFFTETILV